MAGKTNYVSWSAVFNIWAGQIARVLVVNIAVFFFLAYVPEFLTPVIHKAVTDAFRYEEKYSTTLILVFEVIVTMWAGRESLMDKYPRFRFIARNKGTNQSIFGPDKRLTWPVFICVWWAQTWRMLLIPVGAVMGSLTALVVSHPHAANYSHLIHPMLLKVSIGSLFLFSFLATRESLADRYHSFEFGVEGKTFYRDGTNS